MDSIGYIASFAVRKRSLTGSKKLLLQQCLPSYSVDVDNFAVAFSKLSINFNKTIVEIGFGDGRHICSRALSSSRDLHIGCEPYLKGVAQLLTMVNKFNIPNIYIYNGDARNLITHFPDKVIDHLYILFPDPWPKRKQNKRRLINRQILELFHLKLRLGARLTIATDYYDYAQAILQCIKYSSFQFVNKEKIVNLTELSVKPVDWVETKYEIKAKSLGLIVYYFELFSI